MTKMQRNTAKMREILQYFAKSCNKQDYEPVAEPLSVDSLTRPDGNIHSSNITIVDLQRQLLTHISSSISAFR